MISDTERREVARSMRDGVKIKTECELLSLNGSSAAIRWLISYVVFRDKKYHSGVDLMNRLADLIEPPYPDATASYKGWRVQVYDPDGELVVKVDGERLEKLAHDAAVELTGIDRDALLKEVDELEKCAWYFGLDFDEDEPLRDRLKEASGDFAGSARRIRKALEVTDA